jgi:hypothetical protein
MSLENWPMEITIKQDDPAQQATAHVYWANLYRHWIRGLGQSKFPPLPLFSACNVWPPFWSPLSSMSDARIEPPHQRFLGGNPLPGLPLRSLLPPLTRAHLRHRHQITHVPRTYFAKNYREPSAPSATSRARARATCSTTTAAARTA